MKLEIILKQQSSNEGAGIFREFLSEVSVMKNNTCHGKSCI